MSKSADKQHFDSYMEFISTLPIMAHAIDKDGNLLSVSDVWLKNLGYEKEEVIGQHLVTFLTDESKTYAKQTALPDYFAKSFIENVQYQLLRKDNTKLDALLSANSLYNEEGEFICSLATFFDISEKKQFEELLQESKEHYREAQKLEAIGSLAEGVAHDFNNILGAIIGYAEMIQDDCPAGSPSADNIDQVLNASHRAKELVKQIFAFGRQVGTHTPPTRQGA